MLVPRDSGLKLISKCAYILELSKVGLCFRLTPIRDLLEIFMLTEKWESENQAKYRKSVKIDIDNCRWSQMKGIDAYNSIQT